MRKVDKRLEEEYERTIHCLSMTTEVKIRTIVETQLIANNLKTLMEVSSIFYITNSSVCTYSSLLDEKFRIGKYVDC
jgi:hypothetical protein